MKFSALFLAACCLSLAAADAQPTGQPNILFICVDDLRPELPSFGKGYIHAPAIEKLAGEGRLFTRHYVHTPTCGASRFALLTGLRCTTPPRRSNNAIVSHTESKNPAPTFPEWFKSHGYNTMAVGKVSHYPGGHYGKNWDEPDKVELPKAWTLQPRLGGLWQNPQYLMHGLANGQHRVSGTTPAIQAEPDASYPDDHIVEMFTGNLPKLTAEKKPWLCMVGLLRPHLPFGCPKQYLDLYSGTKLPPIPAFSKPAEGDYWHDSGEFKGSYVNPADPNTDEAYATTVRKHYAACVSYADNNVAKILAALEKSGQADNTIIILWGDHGWHLGEQKIWGKHTPYAVALHSPLIIRTPAMANPGKTAAITESVDLYPTLCELARLPAPDHLEGASLSPQLSDPAAATDGQAIAHWGKLESIITSDEHQIRQDKKVLQRYDLASDPYEADNLAGKE